MVLEVSDRSRKPKKQAREEPPPQVGKRPSPPALLFAISAMWIVVGVILLVSLSASWKFIPGIVCIGLGLMYLRGAVITVARRG
jgi:hypothetical protein